MVGRQPLDREPAAETTAPSATPDEAAAPGPGDRVLLVVFWAWAALLLLATLAQLFGWESVIDLLDVKRWFAR